MPELRRVRPVAASLGAAVVDGGTSSSPLFPQLVAALVRTALSDDYDAIKDAAQG